MKTVVYAGDELVTGDDIAYALLKYGEALAESGEAGTIDIPIVDANGKRGVATVLVGPASQIFAKDVDSDHEEIVDDEVVKRLRDATMQLTLTAGQAAPSTTPTADTRWIEEI